MDDEFLRLFNLYKNDIYRLVYSYTGNYADTDDIIQNVFIKLYKHINIFDNDENVKKWLIKVAINECKTLFLSSWKRKIFLSNEKNEEMFLIDDNEGETLRAIMSLDKKYRVIIYLYYYDNYKIREIAKILKMNESTVKTRLNRAKKMLKEILKEA